MNFIELMNCHGLRLDFFTEHEGVHDLVKTITTKVNRDKVKLTGLDLYISVKLILENIVYAKLNAISVSLSNNYYSKLPKRYNPLRISAYKMRIAISLLKEQGLVVVMNGFQNGKISFKTRIEPTNELKYHLSLCGLKKWSIKINRDMEKVILKGRDDKKRKIYCDYKENTKTRKMREFLNEYELFLNSYKFRCKEGVIRSLRFKRVFNNNSFSQGGRFYSDFQNIKSEIRYSTMTCDNEAMKEWDYKGIHINILYTMKGLPLPKEDVYTVLGYEKHRDLFKVALQIALNASTREKAVLGMNKHLIDNKINLREINGKLILDAFIKKHAQIAEYFFSGIGVDLQFKDARICEIILKKSLDKMIPILPVHDSFLVRERDQAFLVSLMKSASKKILGVELQVDSK